MAEWGSLLKPAVRRTVEAMLGGATTLTDLSRATGLTKSALLPHLKSLTALGLVHHERLPTSTGSEAHYRLRDGSLHVSIDAGRAAVLSWATTGAWSPDVPLLGQVPQPEVRAELATLLRALRGATTPAGLVLILYGSAARGEATWKSDLDLLFLLDERDDRAAEAIETLVFSAQNETQHAFSPSFVTREEWNANRKRLVQEAREEGIVVWAARGENAPWSTMKRYAAIRV